EDDDLIRWTRYQKKRELIAEGKPVKPDWRVMEKTAEGELKIARKAENSDEAVKMSEAELRRNMIEVPLEAAFMGTLGETMKGKRKVRAEINLAEAYIAPAQGTNTMSVDFRLIDVATNSEIAKRPMHRVRYKPQGQTVYFGSPIAAVLLMNVASYALSAAASQSGKNKRFAEMAIFSAEKTRKWMAPTPEADIADAEPLYDDPSVGD
ncbi:MAG: hypothetical protein AAGE89_16100, partial [Pseudomonadota bacterium]